MLKMRSPAINILFFLFFKIEQVENDGSEARVSKQFLVNVSRRAGVEFFIFCFQLAEELKSVGLKPGNKYNPYLYTPETHLMVKSDLQARSLNKKRRYKFPEDCYGYFCPKSPERDSRVGEKLSFEPDWAGLTLLSNILVVTVVLAMSGLVCSVPLLTRRGQQYKESGREEVENFISRIELLTIN